jgi:hypothetical protein
MKKHKKSAKPSIHEIFKQQSKDDVIIQSFQIHSQTQKQKCKIA